MRVDNVYSAVVVKHTPDLVEIEITLQGFTTTVGVTAEELTDHVGKIRSCFRIPDEFCDLGEVVLYNNAGGELHLHFESPIDLEAMHTLVEQAAQLNYQNGKGINNVSLSITEKMTIHKGRAGGSWYEK